RDYHVTGVQTCSLPIYKCLFSICHSVHTFLCYYRLNDYIVWNTHYAYTSSTFLTAAFVMMKESYFKISYTFKVFAIVTSILGIFLIDFIIFSFDSSITIKAFLFALILSNILTISLVLGSSIFNSSKTIISSFNTFEVRALLIASFLT